MSGVEVAGRVLVGRYEIVRELGRGAQGRTLLARDLRRADQVAIKVLDFGEMKSWKVLELFEREVGALQRLSHEAIPKYLDRFHVEKEGSEPARYYLVQEYIEGQTLKEQLGAMRHFSEQEVRGLVQELLKILAYLHDLSPPVIHRDVKPSNIMVRAGSGRLALIDFGAVRSSVVMALSSSTIVGTSGYVPPEQWMGRAAPASDLYAVGATAVHLLSQHDPSEMPMAEMRLLYRSFVNVSDDFAGFLDRLLAPHVEDRFQSAHEALDYLAKNKASISQNHSWVSQTEKGSQLIHKIGDSSLENREPLSFTWSEEEKNTYLERVSENYFVHELLMPRNRAGEVERRSVAKQSFRNRWPSVELAKHTLVGLAFYGGIFASVLGSHWLIVERPDGGASLQFILWLVTLVIAGCLLLNELRVVWRVLLERNRSPRRGPGQP